MSEKLNTFKNLSIALLSLAAGSVVKKVAKKVVGKSIGDRIGEIVGNEVSNWLIGISGSVMATEIDRQKMNFMQLWEFKDKKPDSLNHDVSRLSETVLDLSITEGIGNPYKKELAKQNIELTSELKKEIDDEIKKLQETSKTWNFSDSDAIKYVDFKSNYSNNPLEILISEVELPEICESYPFNDYFKTNFPKVYQIYFGELLKKPEYNKALIAYQRQVQGLMMEAIHQKNNGLTEEEIEKISEKINKIASEDIINAIDEINKSLQDIINQLDEIQDTIKKYFESKKFIIREVNTEQLIIEIPPNNIISVANSYVALNAIIEDNYYYFEYNSRLYSIDELTEETFDYLTGKIKYNQLFTKRIIEAIKNDCEQQHSDFYKRIAVNPTWNTTSLCERGHRVISESFMGKTIGQQLNLLFAIGKEDNEKKNGNYIKKCRYIVYRTLDLVIFALLSQLWDDVCRQKIELSNNPLCGFFTMKEKQIDLLRNLIRIYGEQKTDDHLLFISDVLAIADRFNEDAKLYASIAELEKFGDNPTILDCYFAEKHLSAFFEYFHFLAGYKVVSMKKIECFNIKNVETKYLHHHDHLKLDLAGHVSVNEKKGYNICNEKKNSLFTYAVLLYKGEDYTKNINLFPFVIDYNALTFEKTPRIAFFRETVFDEKCLEYGYLDKNEDLFLKYDDDIGEKSKSDVIYLTDKEMETYNQNAVYTTFQKIEEQLLS